MSEVVQNDEKSGNKWWVTMIVLLLALLLMVGGITFAMSLGGNEPVGKSPGALLGDPVLGRQVVLKYGCIQCHTDDGTRAQGPSFMGLFGSTVTYIDGASGVVDAEDVRYAMREPAGKVIDGYDPQMPKFDGRISEAELVDMIAYLRSIGVK